jgi:hypothetical protein
VGLPKVAKHLLAISSEVAPQEVALEDALRTILPVISHLRGRHARPALLASDFDFIKDAANGARRLCLGGFAPAAGIVKTQIEASLLRLPQR